ncbi:hypothetical protein LNTAR_15662 [Lentisphaera araneosa HTCC2155]|uniref:Activator of Hsp90 ATPase homologue 1/2-like C-terminal domain-containing protein n=1 Tax=Lentisphaera araneosa HTCC2155 TaxID=313628 RepID=A6DMD0_9BACT|nr:SRPBCC domain-containing protein [Lentisphaera araneosa]EDM27120.1 hypothetical protein LNTAR_15662 [Lentisphaera araneosa HTCC2155]
MKPLFFTLLILMGAGLMANEVKFEQMVYIKTTKAKLWNALTQPETINKYYMCPILKMGSKKGEIISYGVEGQTFIEGEILEFKKQEKLTHSFRFAGKPKAKGDQGTMVTYEIVEQQGLLILILTHSGFRAKNQTYKDITGGWPYILSNLKTLLETGKTLRK